MKAAETAYLVTGGNRLQGKACVQGAKNAALPMIAAALLVQRGESVIRNVPALQDIYVQIELARSVGARVDYDAREHILLIDASAVSNSVLDPELTRKSRGSILFLPPLLHRLGAVEFHGSGGCSLGARKMGFHQNGLKRLGARIEGTHDQFRIEAERLRGNLLYLDIPSHTGTENLMMAAALASGSTIIENAASDPEVVDLANLLGSMGAVIHGAGTGTILVEGVPELHAAEYTVMPDRLDAAGLVMASAITQGDTALVGAELDRMRVLVAKLGQMGVRISSDGPVVRVRGPERLKPVNIITWPYPGFSTDLQPGIMALAAVADGRSYIRENMFENRFSQIEGLNALGARITRKENLAEVEGVESLTGTSVSAHDIRAGMALVLAGLAAEGKTLIENAYQINRGHLELDQRLKNLGAQIDCVTDTSSYRVAV
ncbi:MAG: UDP-N-acetylglucosamine 1-carboxyvinyltransferase [Acidobacteriota bacterium]